MEKLFVLSAVLLITTSAGFAQVKIHNLGAGKISVVKGKLHSVIDLSGETAGCAYIGGAAKRELDKKGCAAPPATYKLIDAATKNNQNFLIVESDAAGGCNACGHCGASESYALIWLKLNARLRVIERKSVPVDDCILDIISREAILHENNNLSDLKLVFVKNVLTVEFEKTLYGADNATTYEFSHLEYNRKTPEKGFVIKTETRTESSISEGN